MSTTNVTMQSFVFLDVPETIAAYSALTVSGALSLIGSIIVLYLILRHRNCDELYQRIIFGMTLTDVIMTISVLLQPYLTPASTGKFLASGDRASCAANGFIFQFFLGSYIYSAELSLYFLLAVRYNQKDREISKRMEPYIHILPFVVPLAVAVASLSMDLLQPGVMLGFCDINPYPQACSPDSKDICFYGVVAAYVLGWVASGIVVVSSIVGIVATWLVYWTVRRQTKRVFKHTFNNQVDKKQQKRAKAVATQAILYSLAFINGSITVLIGNIMDDLYVTTSADALRGRPGIFVLVFLVYLLFPLKGFFSYIIYIRPRLTRWKETHPQKSLAWAHWQLLAGRSAPSIVPRQRTPPTVDLEAPSLPSSSQ